MRRVVGTMWHRQSDRDAQVSFRDRMAIRKAIDETPSPTMRAELAAVAARQHGHMW